MSLVAPATFPNLCTMVLWKREANSGGPASRRRTERVLASLLRDETVPLRLPRVIRAGLHFGERDSLSAVLEVLAR